MKKRLLALVLCLVLATSLLPITAAADTYHLTSVTIKASGVKQLSDGNYHVIVTSAIGTYDGGEIDITPLLSRVDSNRVGTPVDSNGKLINKPLEEGTSYLVTFRFNSDDSNGNRIYLKDDLIPVKLEIPGYAIGRYSFEQGSGDTQCSIHITKEHEHTWQFKQAGNTLTGYCRNCDIQETLTLTAHSVTLPTSPFNARLEGKEQFETATGAAISKIRYDYKGSDGVWHKDVDPVAANAKAGEYQAFVQITNLPRPVEIDGPVAMAENPDGTYTADLFVHYTAADPAVTAQTGDNRPIELMMAGVAVFSALAAAAFVLDHKRRYSR